MNKRQALEPNAYNQWKYRLIGYVSLFVFGAAWVLAMDWVWRVS